MKPTNLIAVLMIGLLSLSGARTCLAETPTIKTPPDLKLVAQLLTAVAPNSTYAQVKRFIPDGVKLGKMEVANSLGPDSKGQMQNWNFVSFSGRMSGQIVFFNARPKGKNQWQSSDPVHAIYVFIGPKLRPISQKKVDQTTARDIAQLTSYLGKPTEKSHNKISDYPYFVGGWDAFWKKPKGRAINYYPGMTFGFDEELLMANVTFPYSKLYSP